MANFDGEHGAPAASQALTTGTPSLIVEAERPSLWLLLRVWFMLGLQSFGGGMATLYLIRRATVERHRWLTAEEFTRDWALCQAAPGINLLCMTILVGRQVAGLAGALVALVGLLLPSVTLTIVMIALYADLRKLPVVQAALHGVVPGTVGLGLLLTINMARPLLVSNYRESVSNLLIGVLLLVGSALGVLVWHLPVIVVLCSAGAIGALTTWRHSVQVQPAQEKRSQP